jgi:hypothetical protein
MNALVDGLDFQAILIVFLLIFRWFSRRDSTTFGHAVVSGMGCPEEFVA